MRPDEGGAGAVLEVDLGAIVANWRLLGSLHPSGPVAGVVKADGYGLGARPVTTALHGAGCRHFFVALLDEALAIRDCVPGAMVAVLGGLIPGNGADFLAHDIVPVLGSLAEIDAWTDTARTVARRRRGGRRDPGALRVGRAGGAHERRAPFAGELVPGTHLSLLRRDRR